MNIFHLDTAPDTSARMLCDKHIPKMLLETCQMLSTAVRNQINNLADDVYPVYKSAYPKHPMTIWVGKSWENFRWTLEHGKEINNQYQYRFGKIHKSSKVLEEIRDRLVEFKTPDTEQYCLYLSYNLHDEPPQCMPDEFKCDDYVEAYRAYYRKDKRYILQWTGRPVPEWVSA